MDIDFREIHKQLVFKCFKIYLVFFCFSMLIVLLQCLLLLKGSTHFFQKKSTFPHTFTVYLDGSLLVVLHLFTLELCFYFVHRIQQ